MYEKNENRDEKSTRIPYILLDITGRTFCVKFIHTFIL